MINIKTFAANNVNLYIISDKSFAGDRNQLLGVTRETKEYFKTKNITLDAEEYDVSQLKNIKEQIANSKNLAIILSAGYYGIESILSLKSDPKLASKIITVHLSHQLLNSNNLGHDKLVQKK